MFFGTAHWMGPPRFLEKPGGKPAVENMEKSPGGFLGAMGTFKGWNRRQVVPDPAMPSPRLRVKRCCASPPRSDGRTPLPLVLGEDGYGAAPDSGRGAAMQPGTIENDGIGRSRDPTVKRWYNSCFVAIIPRFGRVCLGPQGECWLNQGFFAVAGQRGERLPVPMASLGIHFIQKAKI